jgi:hypothetical protein
MPCSAGYCSVLFLLAAVNFENKLKSGVHHENHENHVVFGNAARRVLFNAGAGRRNKSGSKDCNRQTQVT